VTQNPQFSGAADCLQGHYVMQALLTPFNTETNCYEEITHQQNPACRAQEQAFSRLGCKHTSTFAFKM
jgi:hypothetical protein